jgi:hypothetical protein
VAESVLLRREQNRDVRVGLFALRLCLQPARTCTTPSFVIPDAQLRIADAPLGAGPESILSAVVMDSGLAQERAPE